MKDMFKALKDVLESKELNKVHDTEKLLRFIKGDSKDDDRFM